MDLAEAYKTFARDETGDVRNPYDVVEERGEILRAAMEERVHRRECTNPDELRGLIRRQLLMAVAYVEQKLAEEDEIQDTVIPYKVESSGKGVTRFFIDTRHLRDSILKPGEIFRMKGHDDVIYAQGKIISIHPAEEVGEGGFLVTAQITPRKGFPREGSIERIPARKILEHQLVTAQYALGRLNKFQGSPDTIRAESLLDIFCALGQTGDAPGDTRGVKLQPDTIFEMPSYVFEDRDQAAAISAAVLDESPIVAIHGPPGTGKTTVAVEIARILAAANKSILLVSHSNKGLDRALIGMKDALRDKESLLIRGGKLPDRIDPQLQHNSLEEMVGGKPPKRKRFLKNGLFDKEGYKRATKKYKKEREEEVDRIREDFFHTGGVYGTTLGSFCSNDFLRGRKVDYVIVDEASRGMLHEILSVLQAARIKIIFVGDHLQLGNMDLTLGERFTLSDNVAQMKGADRLPTQVEMDRFQDGLLPIMMEEFPCPRVMLRTNRRSGKNIIGALSPLYGGELMSGRDENGTVVWLDTKERDPETCEPNRERKVGSSFTNRHEATLVARQVKKGVIEGGLKPSEIGITSPYAAQVREIKSRLAKVFHPDDRLLELPEPYDNEQHLANLAEYERQVKLMEEVLAEVHTVDSLQGSQRDTIYASMVVSNMRGRIGFVKELRRLRVILSRARNKLVIVGNSAALVDRNPDPDSREAFSGILDFIREHGTLEILQPLSVHGPRAGHRANR